MTNRLPTRVLRKKTYVTVEFQPGFCIMRRIVKILLYLSATIACAVGVYAGYNIQQTKLDETGQPTENKISCTELLEQVPSNLERFELTEYYPGLDVVEFDNEQDGNWELAFVPMSDRPLSTITKNYHGVIVCFTDVKNQKELSVRLRDGFESEFWQYSQKLNSITYNRMAEVYPSMDFQRCVIVYSGVAPSSGHTKYVLWASLAGMLLSMMAMGWQVVDVVFVAIKKSAAQEDSHDEQEEEEPQEFGNRAGLPSIDR